MQSVLVSTLFSVTALLATSCGTNQNPSALNAEPGNSVSDKDAALFLGQYAIRGNLATIQNLPFVGKTPALSSAYSLLTLERDGSGVKAIERNCHITITSSGPVKQLIPDALPQSAAPIVSPFRIWPEGGSLRFAKDESPIVIGAKVQGHSEALPTSASDARVVDQDGDGHPGVTVKVSGLITGEIYLVQRVRQSWSGQLDADGNLSFALMQDAGEQTILDASSSLLKKTPDISKDPDASKTNVSFVKLPATEDYDCSRLIKEIDSLWPAG
jgi:hypothetical protein